MPEPTFEPSRRAREARGGLGGDGAGPATRAGGDRRAGRPDVAVAPGGRFPGIVEPSSPVGGRPAGLSRAAEVPARVAEPPRIAGAEFGTPRPTGGEPLPRDLRARMEAAFGADFSAVRLHADAESHGAAVALGTDAFTDGAHIFLGPQTSARDERTLAHELAHVRQAVDRAGTPVEAAEDRDSDAEAEATAAAERVIAGGSAGSLLAVPRARLMRNGPLGPAAPALLPVTPVLPEMPAFRVGTRFVEVPGSPGLHAADPGAPFEADALVALLRAALREGTTPSKSGFASRLSVLEVLRLGDRATWAKARVIFEKETGETLLAKLRDELSEKEFGSAVPYLRGVVPTEDLVRVWSGTFSSDVPGVLRTIERMPDDEALAFVTEYRTMLGLKGTSALSLASAIEETLKGEDDGAYRALRTLAARIQRVSTAVSATLTDDDRAGARELASQLRVKAAFVRIKEADREYRADWAYLAVADLGPHERYWLDVTYLRSWRGWHIRGDRRTRLETLVDATVSDADLILRALEESRAEVEERGGTESAVGLQVAAEALGPALTGLAAHAADETLPQTEREDAQDRLNWLASDDATIDRLLALPGGENLARRLGLPASALARRRVLRATSVSEVVEALRGLHGIDVSRVLSQPDVEAHLAEEEIVINPGVQRVLNAYGTVQGARAEPLLVLPPGTSFLDVAGLPGLEVEDLDLEAEPATAPTFELVLPAEGEPEDALVVVAAYEAYQAAKKDDVAGVVAAVRDLRPGQRAAIQDEEFFRAALTCLRSMRTDVATTVATVLADPSRSVTEASTALVTAGLMGEPGYAFDIQDERMLAEGLAVEPADRRLLRYHYVLEALGEEDRLAGKGDWFSRRAALGARGVPVDLEIPSQIESAYSDRLFALDRLEPTPRLKMEEVFLGEPEVFRADLTPEEAALEAEFMRIRLDRHLAALSQGIDASGVFGWSPETLTELTAEFRKKWDALSADGRWTRDEVILLAAAYYDALDAIDRNRSERDEVAEFVGTLAAVVAGIVVIVATGGTGTPFVLAILEGAVLGAGASRLVAGAFRDYTSPDEALGDIGRGAVTGALTVAGELLARPVVAIASRQMASFAARGAVNRAVAGGARLAIEGAIDGAVGGAGEAVFATAIDRRTWERGVSAIFARFLSAAVEGAFWGGLTGGVAGPVLGGGLGAAGLVLRGARGLLRKAGVALADVPGDVAARVDQVAALADKGRFDVALRRLDEITELSGADRDRITQELYRRALGSTEEGAAVSADQLRRLDEARQVTRRLEEEAGPRRPGERRPRLDVGPIEDLLRRLEADLGAAEVAHVRKIIYGEIRLSPEELIVKQAEYEKGLEQALGDLLTPAERAALPPFEVRVLPPEAFEGMFRTSRGRALTIAEGDGAVVYVRSDAPVRAHMLQEAAHLRQLGDPSMAADLRFLAERNVLDWAEKSAEDRLHLLSVQRRLEVDAQERIIAALEKDAPWAADAASANAELDLAKKRLARLRAEDVEARAITPEALTEMNAGIRRRPAWMDEESRLFGSEVEEIRPAESMEELKRREVEVKDSSGLKKKERAFQLGDQWKKTTYATSGVDGTVESLTTVTSPDGRPATAVSVAPTSGGDSRVYLIETTTPGGVDVAVGTPVARGDRLGREVQHYRYVEIRKPGAPARLREEVLDVKGRWVERGTSRSTKGAVLEEAAELQEAARLTAEMARVPSPRSRKPRVRKWIKADLPKLRRGFDRALVEFRGEGADTVAVVRVLEVKDYPNSYVPHAEFTAITTNFETNLKDLRAALKKEVTDLAKAGDADAARALQKALDENSVVVEIWLGPGTKMGSESATSSVLSKLRTSIEGRGPNIKLAAKPARVTATSRKQALAVREAAKKSAVPPAPPPAPTP